MIYTLLKLRGERDNFGDALCATPSMQDGLKQLKENCVEDYQSWQKGGGEIATGAASPEGKVGNGYYTVVCTNWKAHYKSIQLGPSGLCLDLPRSACVSEGDTVLVDSGQAWVVGKNGMCRLLPPFARHDTLRFGGSKLDILVKEITEPDEYEAWKALAEFHYRKVEVHGRKARLIARCLHPLYPAVIGYVELATPFYMNKARAKVLDAPFSADGIGWARWDKETMRKYIHLIVRIARCVVYPEFRGLGLGQLLVRRATEFASDRWQVAGYLPFFLEISADMLKFVPFAERAGMTFVGETEGNLGRVWKDMEYLTRNVSRVKGREIVREESCGIVDQQVARMDRLLFLMQREGLSREQLLDRLKNLSRSAVLKDFALFHNIVSLPKPTYMKGLDPEAEEFLHRRVSQVVPSHNPRLLPLELNPLTEPIKLSDISLSFISRVRRTKRTHAIQQAFGISPDAIETVVVRHLSLELRPREIILVAGPSGSGKTALIQLLAAGPKGWRAGKTDGDVHWPLDYNPGVLEPIRSQKALIEVIGITDVSSALCVMGLVGLSDALVYLKRFDELSRGQQYRAMLARMIVRGYNVWLVDEFCANLDPITAVCVAEKLGSIARKLGATVVVAAPHYTAFLAALKPDKVVQLTTTSAHSLIDGNEFLHAVQDWSIPKYRSLSLRMHPALLAAVLRGEKRSTIRTGQRHFEVGPLVLQSGSESALVRVTAVQHKSFRELTEEDAKKEGYNSLEELRHELRLLYPSIRQNSPLTLVEFELPRIIGPAQNVRSHCATGEAMRGEQ